MTKNTQVDEHRLSDRNIVGYLDLVCSRELKELLPLTDVAEKTIREGRECIENILARRDHRKILIIGPCSIHNTTDALEFAERLMDLSLEISNDYLIVMRTYFEKPRTMSDTWEGIIYDPNLNGSKDINKGLYVAREFLIRVAEIGMPTATEFMGVLTPQYIDDLISWAAIGARTCESPLHKQMASGLSMPVGFKNTTSGDIEAACRAAKAATFPQMFVGVSPEGLAKIIPTEGNPYSHIVLRGGNGQPNYSPELVWEAAELMKQQGLRPNIIVDCSHGNTNKRWEKQPEVFESVMSQIAGGNQDIIGVMVESYLLDGNQAFNYDPSVLRYGLSITDGCIGWEKTHKMIMDNYRRN